jgi:hypothetical protein
MSQSNQRSKSDIEKSSVIAINDHLIKPIINYETYVNNSLNNNQVMDDYKNQIIDQISDKKDKKIETNEQIL